MDFHINTQELTKLLKLDVNETLREIERAK